MQFTSTKMRSEQLARFRSSALVMGLAIERGSLPTFCLYVIFNIALATLGILLTRRDGLIYLQLDAIEISE